MTRLFDEDLPAEAREIADQSNLLIHGIQEDARREIATIQERLEAEMAAVNAEADQKARDCVGRALARLKPMQEEYLRNFKLDEALAIREQIRQLKSCALYVMPDPGNVMHLADKVGQSFAFEVVGREDGAVWGVGVYTADSSLATAAVHAGLVRLAERQTVRITIIEPPTAFSGSTRNGVTSQPYGSFSGAFRFC